MRRAVKGGDQASRTLSRPPGSRPVRERGWFMFSKCTAKIWCSPMLHSQPRLSINTPGTPLDHGSKWQTFCYSPRPAQRSTHTQADGCTVHVVNRFIISTFPLPPCRANEPQRMMLLLLWRPLCQSETHRGVVAGVRVLPAVARAQWQACANP